MLILGYLTQKCHQHKAVAKHSRFNFCLNIILMLQWGTIKCDLRRKLIKNCNFKKCLRGENDAVSWKKNNGSIMKNSLEFEIHKSYAKRFKFHKLFHLKATAPPTFHTRNYSSHFQNQIMTNFHFSQRNLHDFNCANCHPRDLIKLKCEIKKLFFCARLYYSDFMPYNYVSCWITQDNSDSLSCIKLQYLHTHNEFAWCKYRYYQKLIF